MPSAVINPRPQSRGSRAESVTRHSCPEPKASSRGPRARRPSSGQRVIHRGRARPLPVGHEQTGHVPSAELEGLALPPGLQLGREPQLRLERAPFASQEHRGGVALLERDREPRGERGLRRCPPGEERGRRQEPPSEPDDHGTITVSPEYSVSRRRPASPPTSSL